MTLAELQAYVGAPAKRGATYYMHRPDGLSVTAWEDDLRGERGWWYGITRACGSHELVVALGWTAGDYRDRDIQIAAELASAGETTPTAAEVFPW